MSGSRWEFYVSYGKELPVEEVELRSRDGFVAVCS